MGNTNDLARFAQQIASQGPHKAEPTLRRVRGLWEGQYVFDTIKAYHVWEHSRYPQYYVPFEAFSNPKVQLEKLEAVDGTNDGVHLGRLTVGHAYTNRVLIFNNAALKNLVKIEFGAIDQWFEEDVPIYCHPKDPYKRIDVLQSSRSVKITLDGVTVAETTSPLLLFETTLRTRYYIPPTDVKWEHLSRSTVTSLCPYKGEANYHHANLDGEMYYNIAWYYKNPTLESAPIAGYICFYNEHAGIEILVNGIRDQS